MKKKEFTSNPLSVVSQLLHAVSDREEIPTGPVTTTGMAYKRFHRLQPVPLLSNLASSFIWAMGEQAMLLVKSLTA